MRVRVIILMFQANFRVSFMVFRREAVAFGADGLCCGGLWHTRTHPAAGALPVVMETQKCPPPQIPLEGSAALNFRGSALTASDNVYLGLTQHLLCAGTVLNITLIFTNQYC